MGQRIDHLPLFAQRDDQVPAGHYNLWRRARIHLGMPQRIRLTGLKEMELILEHDAWVVVDRNRGEVPVLAWTDFAPPSSRGLHEPVSCHLNFYHFLATSLRQPALDFLFSELYRRLRRVR